MREVIESGRTVEQAIEAACEKLGVAREDTDFEIISLPKKGMLGMFGSSYAKVRVFVPESEEKVEVKAAPRPFRDREPQRPVRDQRPMQKREPFKAEPAPKKERVAAAPGSPANQGKIETAKEYLSSILTNMGVSQFEMEVETRDDGAVISLEGEGLGVIIGRRGETLDSIQYLVGLVANRGDEEYYRISVDCHNYRAKRAKTLEELAKRMAQKVLKTGRNSFLEPMNPYERRIIHAAVAEVEGASSFSVGEEPNRRVVISSKNHPQHTGPYERNDRYDRNDRSSGGGDRRGGSRPPQKGYGDRGRRDFNKPNPRPTAPVNTANQDKKSASTDAADLPLYGRIDLD